MKILFLDFDGVMINRASFQIPRTVTEDANCATAHPDCIAALNHILDNTGAKIVVSSTWRIGFREIAFRQIFKAWGVSGKSIGITPRLFRPEVIHGRTIQMSAHRGVEIQKWLDSARAPVESFAILDDDADMEHLSVRLIQTSFETGLTMSDANRAISILAGERPDSPLQGGSVVAN